MATPSAPKVQSISQLMADLAPGYDEQAKVIGKQQEAVGQEFAAQRQGLDAIKGENFNQINSNANAKGMAFSGIPAHEQARYLSTEYLPGVQASYAQENQQKLSLSQQLAQLRTDQRNRAFDTRTTQQGWLQNWNVNERNISATAEQNALNRSFQKSERIAGQNFTASQNAADRAASAARSGGGGSSVDSSGIIKGIDSFLKSRRGKDGKVAPGAFQAARSQWVAAGGDASAFAQTFSGYVNQKHIKDYY